MTIFIFQILHFNEALKNFFKLSKYFSENELLKKGKRRRGTQKNNSLKTKKEMSRGDKIKKMKIYKWRPKFLTQININKKTFFLFFGVLGTPRLKASPEPN